MREANNVTRSEIEQQALTNATTSQSVMNYRTIYAEFSARGIPMDDIKPRENVFTYNAWRALGRQVKRGERGVKIVTFVVMSIKQVESETSSDKTSRKRSASFRRPWSTTVFHVSQTEAIQ